MNIEFLPTQWFSIPEIAELIGVKQREVRSMLEDGTLIAVRRGENRAWMIYGAELRYQDGAYEPIPALKGTVTVLDDCGLTNEEKMSWLLEPVDELGASPIEALGEGNTHAVRRLALMQA